MGIVLPIDFEDPHYSVDIELSGQLYRFKVDYIERSASWKMNISLPDGTALVNGLAIKTNADLLEKYSNENLPPGTLVCLDTSGKELDPDRDSLGKNHILFYEEF